MTSRANGVDAQIAIVGAGFSGLGAAIRLRQQGMDDFVILERGAAVGGTWRDNSYPGCACDVESHLYSFSFAPNPDWSHSFSPQPEIWSYLEQCARDLGILPNVRFDHEVLGATWDDDVQCWRIETTRRTFVAPVLVLAPGALSEPVIPALPGIERFEGPVFHSARWNHDIDLTGRRVAVVGTGASAIQFVPEIQPRVARLHLFQRTAPWIVPRFDRPLTERERRLFRRFPFVQRLVRTLIYLRRELVLLGFRHARVGKLMERVAVRHLEQSVSDPVLRAKLTPSYAMGCKRVLISNDYLPAVRRANVEVVTEEIAEVHERSIVGRDGVERQVDAIIFGTGFRPTAPPLAAHVRGRGGITLEDAWQGSPKAYAGTTIAGFPNLFMLLGPNTGLGHNSVVYMIEAQIEHLLAALRHMRRHSVGAVEPRAEAQARWVARIEQRMRGTVWTAGGCRSWYLDATGRNSALWPDFSWRFRRRVRHFDPSDYLALEAPARRPMTIH